MGTYANPQKICLKASTRPRTVDKYCTGGTTNGSVSNAPLGAVNILMDADMPPSMKGMEVFLRFASAPIPKLFSDLQSERYFDNRYIYRCRYFPKNSLTLTIESFSAIGSYSR
jgi:hypothetical protein